MKKKVYHLGTCTTCQRIMKDVGVDDSFEQQDIKTEAITAKQLDEMKKMAGSYMALFSRRAMKYKEYGLGNKDLTEANYRKYILEEYTFLKRPVFIIGDEIFVGNAKSVVEDVKAKLASV